MRQTNFWLSIKDNVLGLEGFEVKISKYYFIIIFTRVEIQKIAQNIDEILIILQWWFINTNKKPS